MQSNQNIKDSKALRVSPATKRRRQSEAEFGNNKTASRDPFFAVVVKNYAANKSLSIPMFIFVVFSVCCTIGLPLLTQQMTLSIYAKLHIGQPSDQWWGLVWYVNVILAICLTLFNSVCIFLTRFFSTQLSNRIEIKLREQALAALVRQDISYYSDKKIGDILTRVISDTQIVGEQASQIPVTIIQAILTVGGTVGMMFYFEWRLALIVLGIFALIMVTMVCAFPIVSKRIKKVRDVISDVNGQVTDRINNIRLVKSTGTEVYEIKRFNEIHNDYRKQATKMAGATAFLITTIFGGIGILQTGVVACAMLLYQGKSAEVAGLFFGTTFSSFSLAQGAMVGSLFQAVMVVVGMSKAKVSAARIEEIIIAPSLIDPHTEGRHKGIEIKDIDGDIIFSNVRFAYPEKPSKTILPEFNYTFKKGKSYAFVGETGSGKSTISKLLLRYYDPTEGNVYVNNNVNLKDVNLSSYLDHIGYVEQEPSILFGDVYDNIRYGSFEATDEEVVEAAKKAGLHDLISNWPDGYKTILGEHGLMLSGGQKQRLVIARTFLKNPQILILDEATSALDNIVEKEIQGKLDELMQGRTTITIAHRLSTIKNADEIIVLGGNGGGIVQTGTFDELRKIPGHFKNLYEAGLMS